jgi:hypothetical protein
MRGITAQLTPNPASGNLTADGTEQVLASSTSLSQGGVFALLVDGTNMAGSDLVTLRAYSNANTANDRLAYVAQFTGAQLEALKISPPIPVEIGGRLKVTLQQSAGTYRTFQWKVLEL